MTAALDASPEPSPNPLDIVEEIVAANQWPFDRPSEDELVVEITGKWCDYRLYFMWRDHVRLRRPRPERAPARRPRSAGAGQ